MKKLLLILCLLLIPLTAQGARTWPTSELILNEDSVIIKDEFLSGLLTTGSIGELGWNLTGTGGTITNTDTTRTGSITLTTPATSANSAIITLKPASTTTGMTDFASEWDMTWIVKIPTITSDDWFVFTLSYSSDNSKYAGFQVNTYSTWRAVNKDTSATNTDTGITATAGQWYKLRAKRTSTTIQYYIDDVLVATNSTNLPTGQGQPRAIVYNGLSSARYIVIDYFSLRIPSLTR